MLAQPAPLLALEFPQAPESARLAHSDQERSSLAPQVPRIRQALPARRLKPMLKLKASSFRFLLFDCILRSLSNCASLGRRSAKPQASPEMPQAQPGLPIQGVRLNA
jgi:hypothetical protein